MIESSLDIATPSTRSHEGAGSVSPEMLALRSEFLRYRRVVLLLQAAGSPFSSCPAWRKPEVLAAAQAGESSASAQLATELFDWCRGRGTLGSLASWMMGAPDVSEPEFAYASRLRKAVQRQQQKKNAATARPTSGGASATHAASHSPGVAGREYVRQKSADVVALVSDVAQKHVEKILKTRREVNRRLRVADLRELWDAVHQFCATMDGITHKQVFNLRNEVRCLVCVLCFTALGGCCVQCNVPSSGFVLCRWGCGDRCCTKREKHCATCMPHKSPSSVQHWTARIGGLAKSTLCFNALRTFSLAFDRLMRCLLQFKLPEPAPALLAVS